MASQRGTTSLVPSSQRDELITAARFRKLRRAGARGLGDETGTSRRQSRMRCSWMISPVRYRECRRLGPRTRARTPTGPTISRGRVVAWKRPARMSGPTLRCCWRQPQGYPAVAPAERRS